jgi:AraC-like DNA-binding protein
MFEQTLIAISTIIPTIVIATALFLSGKERQISNRLLGGLFFIIALHTQSNIWICHYFRDFYPIAHIFNLFMLLLGPLFYLYARSYFEKKFNMKKQYLLLFLPFVLVFPFFLYKTIGHDVFREKHSDQNLYNIFEAVQNALYFLLVPVVSFKNNVSFFNFFFNFKDSRLLWIRFLFFSFVIIWLNKIFTTNIYDYGNDLYWYTVNVSFYFIFIGCFFCVALFMMINRERFLFFSSKYSDSPLSGVDKEKYYEKLKKILEDEKPYLDMDLTLIRLSDLAEIPVKSLSQTINEISGLNFNEYINRYRVDYACRLLDEPDNSKTILEIQFEAGFNSKSVFNGIFKKIKGLTPTEYKKQSAKV